MIFENKIGGEFDNLAQRVVYPYIISYPEFIPIESDSISELSQRQMNDFLKTTLISIYNNPGIIEMPIEKDDCFNDGVLYNTNPELNNSMKKLERKFLEFYNFLFEIGLYGDVINSKLHILKSKKIVNKNKQIIFEKLGLICMDEKDKIIIYSNDYPELCFGLKALSKTCNETGVKDPKNAIIGQSVARLLFMKCLFYNDVVRDSQLYGHLNQNGKYLEELEDFLIKNGYEYNLHDGKYTLVKHCSDNKNGKFKVLFDWKRKSQLKYYFEIPGFTKLVSNYYLDLDDELKELIFSRLNGCSHCGYCIKTGKHELLTVSVEFNGEISEKCPFYPNLNWDMLDEKSVSAIKKLIEFSISIL